MKYKIIKKQTGCGLISSILGIVISAIIGAIASKKRKINCYFTSAYGNIQNAKSKFENEIPLSKFFNPSIQLKS